MMSATEVIEKIKSLSPDEQTKVLDFTNQLQRSRQLTPEEIDELASRMVETSDPIEADRLQREIVRGFYGVKNDAKN